MRFFILTWVSAIYSLSAHGLNRADTIMSLLSLEQKVEMLFAVPQTDYSKDSVKVGNSLYVDYALFDTRPGASDTLALPYPSASTIAALHDKPLRKQLFKAALQQYIHDGYDGIVVPDSAVGLARIYIGNNGVEHNNFMRVIDFPCNLLNNLIANVPLGVKAESSPTETMSFFDQVDLPSLNIWQNKTGYGISFNDLLEHDVLFWENRSYGCRQQVLNAFRYGKLDEALLNKRITRLLNYQAEINRVKRDSNLTANRLRNRYDAYRSSISIYQKHNLLPFQRIDSLKTSITDYRKNTTQDFYTDAGYFSPGIKLNDCNADVQFILCDNENVLLTELTNDRTNACSKKQFKVLVYAGQLARKTMDKLGCFDAVVQMPEVMKLSWSMLAQAIYGGFGVDGISVFDEELNKQKLYALHSVKTRLGLKGNAIKGFETDSISKIDSIVNDAIKKKAMPGAQVLVVKAGNIILQKSYGFHTYDKKQELTNTDLFDVASITKLAVTFPLIMQLYENKVINLNAALSDYISGIDTTDKAVVTIRELLVHQSGLASFIPFYNKALDRESLNNRSLYSRHYSGLYNVRVDTHLYQNKNTKYRQDVFSDKQTGVFQRQITHNMFMNESYVDSMYNYIYTSKLSEEKNYRYSDLGYYLLQKIIEQEEKKSLDTLFYNRFANLLGADKLLYKPLNRFEKSQIAPTENDLSFRHTLLDGYVHDQGAAMLGGVAAHAGLFANAGDLAKMAQMLLNEGQYGGVRFVKANTIREFTKTVNHGNRRGLGVDKPELNPEESSHVSHRASLSSYGHTGFTGGMLWIDPEYDLIYIFLSNRIYPHAYNKKLIEMNVRTKIQDVVYNSFVKKVQE